MTKPSPRPSRGTAGTAGCRSTSQKGIYVMEDEERAEVEEALAQARCGEFVPDDEMDAFWKRIGVL